MTPKQKFSDGEKVLCFHGPLIYEAKALKSTITKDKQVKYYIHYAGWNKNWDEWVPENRVLKYNEANVQRQKEVFRQHNVNNAGKLKKGAPKSRKSEAATTTQTAAATTTKESGASSGGSESRASTPSKEGLNNSTNTATSTRGNRSKLAETASKRDDEANKDDEPVAKKKRGSAVAVAAAAAAANKLEKNATTLTNTSTNIATGSSSSASSVSSTTSSILNSFATPECIDDDDFILKRLDVHIKMPDELKQWLVDDWEAVVHQRKLLEVPAKCSVEDITNQYLQSKKSLKTVSSSSSNSTSSSWPKEHSLNDFINGLLEYFNVMLGSQLLYKYERAQYAEMLQRHPDTQLSQLYGSFHLLRLFVKLGGKLGFTTLDEKGIQSLQAQIQDFLRYLLKNSGSYFTMSLYINVTPEYHRHTQ